MRTQHSERVGTKLWISADETYDWAHRPGATWPGSTLSGKRLFVEFDARGDLVDLAVNGRSDAEVDGHELDALASDFLRKRFGPTHPAIRGAAPIRERVPFCRACGRTAPMFSADLAPVQTCAYCGAVEVRA